MTVSLLFLLILCSTVSWICANIDESHQWQVTVDDRGHMQLVSQEPYIGRNIDQPALQFHPEKDIRFYLYTRSTAEAPQLIANNDYDSVIDSKLNISHPTRIVIHGWGGNINSAMIRQIRTELFNVAEFNVIYVDWSAGYDPFYPNSRRLVYPVGIATSNLIDFLVKTKDLKRKDVVVVGHSLGAHAAGNVGKGQMGRLPVIIGLDPALPFFALDSVDRIKPTDAEYVEVIHTNGGVLGFLEPLGDADFYPNWGRIQPGCGADIGGGCAHQRAVDYYVESISSRIGFVGSKCSSFQDIRGGSCPGAGISVRMGGEPSNAGLRGIFHVATAGGRPFVLGC